MPRLPLILAVLASAVAAQPPGFQIETPVRGFASAVAMAFAPDGRLFLGERNTGSIRVYRDGQLGGVWANLPSVNNDGSEAGLIGLAVDPDFLRNGYVYAYCTQSTPSGWMSSLGRLKDVNGQGTAWTVLTASLPATFRHTGGPIEFGRDGKLYFTAGEGGFPEMAQSLGNPHGKVLRVNAPDGSIPGDNPFAGIRGADGRIWSLGHRQIFGLTMHPASGLPFTTENGAFRGDEVNQILRGANYGWPVYEAKEPAPDALTEDPAWTFLPEPALTGACFYTGALYPATYGQTLFVTSWKYAQLSYLTLDAAGKGTSETLFHQYQGTVVDVVDGPDGNLWALSSSAFLRGGDEVTRFVHTAAPTPSANVTAVSNKAIGGAITLGFVAGNGDTVIPWLAFRKLGSPVVLPWGSLWVPPDLALPTLTVVGDGRAYLGIPVPDDPNLRGQTVHVQAGVVPAGGGGGKLTNPAALTLL